MAKRQTIQWPKEEKDKGAKSDIQILHWRLKIEPLQKPRQAVPAPLVNKKYQTVGTVPKSNHNITERGKIDMSKTYIYDSGGKPSTGRWLTNLIMTNKVVWSTNVFSWPYLFI
jgi:hypothetical protein